MKKITLFLVLLSSVLAIAACGPNKSKTESNKDSDVVNLNFTFWGDTLEKESVDKLVNTFNDSQDKIKVKSQQIPYDNYMEKLNTMASTKTLPDVGYMVESSTAEWGNSGKLKDLSELYAEGGAFEGKIAETTSKYRNGKIYGSPAGPGMLTMFYNKKYFEETGVELPPHEVAKAWDWDTFVEKLKELTVDRNGKHPGEDGFDEKNIATYGISNFTGLGYESFLIGNGGGLVSEDGETILLGKKESIDAIDKLQSLMYEHYVMPKPSQASTIPSTDTALLTNRVAMSITGSWDLRSLSAAMKDKGLNLAMGVLPKMDQKVVQMNFGPPIVVFDNDNTKENWAETQEFLEFLLNPENSIDVINSGLWLPNQNDWYTDPEKLDIWANQENSPEFKKEALVEAKENALAKNKAFYVEDATTIEQIVNPALEQVWTGKKDAKDVIENEIIPKLKKELGDKYKFE
ncbi:sugar ABC transporter substrate-binding protein [Enterococcus sp. JM4C]|uniref:ABC transporter substrate-binding protein n=1 Tax=Candidatus Enterococcus huntleyi TaxID=1857217 RepID=UPI00137A334D|nr:sugar ABC transporter substrate-binding protein [Enterococcus sp. JM4C]KAF1297873.1 sugar ABC transporter substrate-binding protein [Enterococcus sp. JM4C]